MIGSAIYSNPPHRKLGVLGVCVRWICTCSVLKKNALIVARMLELAILGKLELCSFSFGYIAICRIGGYSVNFFFQVRLYVLWELHCSPRMPWFANVEEFSLRNEISVIEIYDNARQGKSCLFKI